jgi:hypothetical protein
MANEITINPTDQVDGQLSADEQESLEIGERLAQEEQQLLAGKYSSTEELEKAYVELQKRLGSQDQQEPEQASEEQQEASEEAEKASLYDAIMEEYRSGEWSQELVDQVSKMNPIDVVNEFLANQQAPSTPQATAQDIQQIQESVGGDEAYQNMIQWAQENLSEQEIGMYDAVMDRGDPLAMFFAAQALRSRFADAQGYDGELLTGSSPRSDGDVFRSQAQLVEAMSDPRYDKDPAYRADVAAKLERSNLQF